MKKGVLVAIFFVLCLSCFSQVNSERLNELLKVSKSQKGDSLVDSLNEISWEFKNSNIDSAFHYARKALFVSKKSNSKKLISYAYNSLANCFETKGLLDSALAYHHKSLNLKIQIQNKVGIADTYNNLGIIHDTKGDYAKALKNYFKALNIYEIENVDFDKVPMVLSNIGIVYKKQKEFKKALTYYQRSLKIYKANNYKFGTVITSGNIGSVLLSLKEFDSSIVYSLKAKDLYASLGYQRYVPYMLHNIAIAKDSLKLYLESEALYHEAEQLYNADGNLYELCSTKLGLAQSFVSQKKYNKSLKKADKALQLSKKQGFREFEVRAYKVLASAYSGLGDYKKAFQFRVLYDKGNETLFEESKTKTIFELETKYETEKKEKEILLQRADIAEKELDITKKDTQLIGLVLLAIAFLILGYLLYSQQKLKNTQLQKESELKEALVKIETQNRLQEQRLNISRDLHDNIGAQLTFIISSIENLQYGFKIKNDKLTSKLTSISGFTRETIYELRDTIWAMNKNAITLEDLESRISNFIDKADISSSAIEFNFYIDQQLDKDKEFTSVIGMNIYRIIQEAINNAIKYSGAKMVLVTIFKGANNTHIEIKDNGSGFDESKIEKGNGLINMRKRANEIGATIQIESDLGKGTKVLLVIS